MPRIIFHLGTYKTGTSSIQNYLYDNRAALLKNGLLYPKTGLTKSGKLGYRHTPILHKFMAGAQAPMPQALIDEIKAADCDTVVLSSEAWSAPGAFSHLNRCICDLKDNGFDDVSAILMLRNIADYRVSHFREFTCNQNNAKPYEDYLHGRHGVFDYLLLVRFFAALFGPQLSVLTFGAGKDSLGSFKEALGTNAFDGVPEPTGRANTKSVDAVDVEILRCLNAAGLGKARGDKLRKKLEATLDGQSLWTERVAGDHVEFPASYRDELSKLSGLTTQEVDALLKDKDIKGEPVTQLTGEIETLLKARRFGMSLGAVRR